jgi:hypothetical protein
VVLARQVPRAEQRSRGDYHRYAKEAGAEDTENAVATRLC